MARSPVEEAEKLRNEGNECLLTWKYKEAIEKYSAALAKTQEFTDNNLKQAFIEEVLLHRSKAYIKLNEWALAYADANEALRLNQNNYIGLMRRAKARLNVGFEAGAVEDVERAMAISREPKNSKMVKLLAEAQRCYTEAQNKGSEKFNELIAEAKKCGTSKLNNNNATQNTSKDGGKNGDVEFGDNNWMQSSSSSKEKSDGSNTH